MLKPFYMLEGEIRRVKEIDLGEDKEVWYEDENGNRSILNFKKSTTKNQEIKIEEILKLI